MILPTASAILIGNSYKDSLIISGIFSEFSIILGFVLSYHLDLSTGPVVILINLAIYIGIIIYRAIRKQVLKKQANAIKK